MSNFYENLSDTTKAYLFDKMPARYFPDNDKDGRSFEDSFGAVKDLMRPTSAVTVHAVMTDEATPPEILEDLFFNSGLERNKIRLLKNPNLPKHIVEYALTQHEPIINYQFESLAGAAISRPEIPLSYIKEVILEGDVYIIQGTVLHPSITEELLSLLCERTLTDSALKSDPDAYLRLIAVLLKHSSTPINFLKKYQDTDIADLQNALLDNHSLPSEILRYLFDTKRMATYQEDEFYFHPNTPIELAANFLADYFEENDYVGNAEIRCDAYLKTLGYDDEILSSIPLLYKLKLVAE